LVRCRALPASCVARCASRETQVELLRAKLEQANNKNDILRENYEMLDTKLTQREEKAAADARLIAQLQNEERRLKEELELTKV
jgi:chromosome segregation ATPase